MLQFSECTQYFVPSAIRNKLFDQPDMISFSAGKPEESSFPFAMIQSSIERVLANDKVRAFQYSDTEGFSSFRAQICALASHTKTKASPDDITLTSGSQQGIYFSAKIFLNPGDVVLCENPSYVGALNVFHSFQAKCVGIPLDADGMNLQALEKALCEIPDVKMIYTIPDFQNPTGVTMSVEKRKKLAELAARYEIPVVEDNPYGELRYNGEAYPSIKSFDEKGFVIYLGTFSKIFCPGLRLGYVIAREDIRAKIILAKQMSDLQCSSFNELIAEEFLQQVDWNDHIARVREIYGARNDLMDRCMKEYFPASVHYQKPQGGFFYWLDLPQKGPTSDELLLCAAKEEKVA
ncbi:MAG: PLP-dependent aminotransferase family protein, partial [Anaerotruncus rubiinfantis]